MNCLTLIENLSLKNNADKHQLDRYNLLNAINVTSNAKLSHNPKIKNKLIENLRLELRKMYTQNEITPN